MFNDEGVRSHNQIQGVDDDGNLRNIKVDENGNIITKVESEEVEVVEKKTLLCNVATIGNQATVININKKVTKLEIANYSENANVTITIGSKTYIVGANLVLDIIINDNVTSISLSSEEENTQIQYLVEGEE